MTKSKRCVFSVQCSVCVWCAKPFSTIGSFQIGLLASGGWLSSVLGGGNTTPSTSANSGASTPSIGSSFVSYLENSLLEDEVRAIVREDAQQEQSEGANKVNSL